MTTIEVDKEAFELELKAQREIIQYQIADWTLQVLVQNLDDNLIFVPEYQRNFVWDRRRQSRFIESLLMGLPVPFVYLASNQEDGRYEIVDGVQRLTTINKFMKGELTLEGLEVMTKGNGAQWSDLTTLRQNKLKGLSLRTIILEDKPDTNTLVELFDRINTGSETATPAEIRQAVQFGPFMDLVAELSTHPKFVEMSPMSEAKEKRRTRNEFVARFFAYGDGLDDYRDNPRVFVTQYAKKMNNSFTANSDLMSEYRARFVNTMDVVDTYFQHGFTKKRDRSGITTANARFEAISLGAWKVIKEQREIKVSPEYVASIVESEKFVKVMGADGANARGKLEGRQKFVYDLLIGDSNQ